MEVTPIVSVIVPLYNAMEHVDALLSALLNQTYPPANYEVIVVDNGSTDGTLEKLRASSRSASNDSAKLVCKVQNTIQTSYATRNHGLKSARGTIIVFTDADCRPTRTWLEILTRRFASPSTGIVAGKVSGSFDTNVWVRYANRRELLDQRRTLGHAFKPYGQTANLAVHRDVFQSIGLFRPKVPSGGDADFCWRASAFGWQVFYEPLAEVEHVHRRSLIGLLRQFMRYGVGHRVLNEFYGYVHTPSPGGPKLSEILASVSANRYETVFDLYIHRLCHRVMVMGYKSFEPPVDLGFIETFDDLID